MKVSKSAVATLFALCASGAAMAQSDWSGFYMGLNAGHISAKSDVNTTTAVDNTGYFTDSEIVAINSVGSTRLKPSGFTGGLTLGYNWQRGHGFFGLEGDYNHFSQGDSRSITFADPYCTGIPPAPASCSYTLWQNVNVSHLATFRLRAGWASEHWMIYGTIGGANTKLSYSEVFTDTFASAYQSSSQNHSKGGSVWGIGTEAKWAKHWSIKAEWLHARFSNMSGPGGLMTTTVAGVVTTWPLNTWNHSSNLSLDMARVGINYRF